MQNACNYFKQIKTFDNCPNFGTLLHKVPNGIARVLFTVDGNVIVLLHGFIKKSQKIPKNELKTALSRLKEYQED
ncbi:MAG: type II toxin-antitoxin system RelE/ParE family toxin [Proteobacteria bacterium]|nr:type II toxin-antitoxin system RelE/ParE family toxin [Pseudomonadota bacterium]